jgi:hypothetical protein
VWALRTAFFIFKATALGNTSLKAFSLAFAPGYTRCSALGTRSALNEPFSYSIPTGEGMGRSRALTAMEGGNADFAGAKICLPFAAFTHPCALGEGAKITRLVSHPAFSDF